MGSRKHIHPIKRAASVVTFGAYDPHDWKIYARWRRDTDHGKTDLEWKEYKAAAKTERKAKSK